MLATTPTDELRIRKGCVRASTVCVMQQASLGAPCAPCTLQRFCRERGVVGGADTPTQDARRGDATREQVEHDGQIEPSLVRRDVTSRRQPRSDWLLADEGSERSFQS
jgi:hypothetical protein